MAFQDDILIATGLYPPDIGGPATYSKILKDELPKRGLSVKILSFGEVRHLPKLVRHLFYAWRVFRLIPKSQVIYVQDPVSVGLPVMVACFLRRRSYFLKVVGDYAWEQGSQRFGVTDLLDDFSVRNNYARPVKILKKIQLTVARRAKKIIVPSEYLKKIVGNWGVDRNKIQVIYNAFEPKDISLTKEEARRDLGLSSNEDKILISSGRLVPWKGFATLIEILPEILIDFSGTKLLIAGSGPEKNNLETKIKAKNLSESVKMLGQLERDVLFKYLRASDLFVLNTAYEGFSHQLLEVMSLGTIALVTNIGGNPELIKNESQLFEYDDKKKIIEAIKSILKMPSEKREEIATAQKYVNTEFTKDKMLDNLISTLGLNNES